jgi:hypothetical protein
MTFSDSDWTRDPPRRPRLPPTQRRALILAVAIALACVAMALALYGVEQVLDAQARDEALRRIGDGAASSVAAASMPVSTPVAAARALPSASAAVLAAPAASAAAARTEDEVDRQQMATLEAEMRQRAGEAAQQAAAEAVRRKERAWERWYQRPAFCADNPTGAQMVQCANHHIRARKEFEERYAAGRL